MELYDLIVIGGGPAGYNAAEKAGAAGIKTLVLEKRALGGVCLNEGCIPSKALLYSAKVYDYTKHGEQYGVTVQGSSIDQKAVIARKNKVVKSLVSGIGMTMKKHGVTVVNSEAQILGRGTEGFEVSADGKTYTGRQLLIATGSTPVIPPIPGLREGVSSGFVLTNREVLDLQEVPREMVIIGGGVIGLEMASYYNSAGSHVTVIEMLDHIAGNTDSDISGILKKNYQSKGITFKLGCKVTAVNPNEVIYEENGQIFKAKADKVLCSIGRAAVTTGFGLENIHVHTERSGIKTDEQMRTNVAGVYAAGDVNGISMLAHTAYREGEVAVNTMLGKKDRMRYNAIPSVIYTNPEVGSVGETEESAKKKGYDVETVNLTMRYSGRYVAENEGGDGIVKVIVDKKYRRLLGVHMISNYASEIIYGAALMIETEMRVENLKEIVFPHPTVCEVIREALFEIK
ncbi:MAG: dihydrolipoyl dehydrogenase [Oscillospiraceae bacterium]|nr:dihydrolipoyl dehydrogenase [Oscillospiraceae bacterium]MDD4413349.1 dihydrolipoyl dehydrogenase [Oscillospiraceae bacterium]